MTDQLPLQRFNHWLQQQPDAVWLRQPVAGVWHDFTWRQVDDQARRLDSALLALGCAPGLGFVHVKHEGSFVYDIADLYKAEVVIPLAFEVAAQAPQDLPSVMRRRVRDAMVEHHILERMVHDVRWLLLNEEEQAAEPEAVYLWDSKIGTVANGVNYFDAEEGEEPSLS